MNIGNFTPHPIHILDRSCVRKDASIRKYVLDGDPVVVAEIPPSGTLLNVTYEDVAGEPINGIPVTIRRASSVDAIPDGVDVAVVSGLYASATKDPRAYTVIDPVYTPDGRTVVGCLGLGKVE